MTTSDGPDGDGLPAAIEERASEILLGPPELVEARFAELCAAHAPLQPDLLRLRADYQRAARLLAPPPRGALPAAIGPYRIVRQLGEGAFGVVFLAEQEAPLRREVAIKLLHASTASRTAGARFLLERETLARMDHPAIARIFDAGVDEAGRPYFVMEYVPGEPLHRFVATRAADLRARLALFLAVCDAVHHAHQRGVIHRDLKPQNILVTDVDGAWLPKVIDFGLAKVVEGDIVDVVRTQSGAMLGTPAYMSPEQVRGDGRAVDIRTDVWALGVMLYELVTTARPLDADSARGRGFAELQRRILEDEAPRASGRAAMAGVPWARQLRGDLDWILGKAMQKRADERYASVAEFAADVRRCIAHEPVLAGPPRTVYLVRKFVRRHRGGVAAVAVVFVALLAGFLVSAVLYREARANERLARGHLADFWRLADVLALDDLLAEAKTMWPSMPEKLAQHEAWLAVAHALVARREVHANTAAALRARLAATPADLGADERNGAQFLLASLQRHLAALTEFTRDDGVLRDVERRSEFARTVQERSIDAARAAWDRAIDAIAESPRYDGMLMRRVPGLLPLGPDPGSGLEEFAHLQSGRVPTRGADGRLEVADDTAIVLVLVPGGTVKIGSQASDATAAHYDPYRQAIEAEIHAVTLSPFLLGKYELTQGQVQRLGIAVQAMVPVGGRAGASEGITARHPEEQVLAPVVLRWLPQFELRVPTSDEWEVAARAGSAAIWGVDDRKDGLATYANFADRSYAEHGWLDRKFDPDLADGCFGPAPVGSYPPNAFGLHDMLGNVAELTVRWSGSDTVICIARGGSFLLPPLECRIGSMRVVAPNQTTPEIGVRVARSVPRD